ncbi:hypothetical protein RI129_011487 [Pyrocoelia pectoralis]|uniref:leucine--tRNA ligase n=1 Tax=Pyrocoelia pectoralis TaxID=417401 RepID=A0AAN7V839_9COLE
MISKLHKLLRNVQKTSSFTHIRGLVGLGSLNEELTSELKHKIEQHWKGQLSFPEYDEKSGLEKYYVLSMFPYPSGNLHMGHVRVYTISDTIARYQRMNNKNVIHPIGWDAFGLPAENAAIERKVAPSEWTKLNIAQMKQQLHELSCTFEWERELATCDKNYYKWTQDLFLKLYDNGFAYQKEAYVNWDPIDQTVLADEQVDENMRSWRSGAKIERKLLRQWFIRTTRFASDLYNGLDDHSLKDWQDITKIQKNWIGECNGVTFDFPINGHDPIHLWTRHPEYATEARFLAVSNSYLLSKCEGIELMPGTKRLGLTATNPLNGETLPIFVTDLVDYFEFCDTHIGLPTIFERDRSFCDRFDINYKFVGDDFKGTQLEVCKKAQELGVGGYWTSAKLRDWLISRQRYWGTPIPIIHCKGCGPVPVPRSDLPVELPKLTEKCLLDQSDWVNTTCPKCKLKARRETDTMDTFVDSSWYYLRYLNVHKDSMFDTERAKKMIPVDLYIGGKEHATLHLYYARFISHFLYSLGLLPEKEPFKRLLVQGMVMGRSFRLRGSRQYVPGDQVNVLDAKRNKAFHKETNQPVVTTWEKMSKSKYNGIDPSEMFKKYGIDTTRLLILADVAPTSHRNWNSNTFPGVLNWQKRLWLTVQEFIAYRSSSPPPISNEEFKRHDDYLFDSRNYYVKGANFNFKVAHQFNVVISKMQGLTNSLRVNNCVNGIECCIVKIPRHRLELLSDEEVLEVALQQKEVKDTLNSRQHVKYKYLLQPCYEGLINIVVAKSAESMVL